MNSQPHSFLDALRVSPARSIWIQDYDLSAMAAILRDGYRVVGTELFNWYGMEWEWLRQRAVLSSSMRGPAALGAGMVFFSQALARARSF
ncbi:unnamed protein product [Zymoseptoria tritici ST99CH_1E4]|uniref:Uncharacterized protein n=1 Tax=Zymoseptoria tritici ST99CH_1E4 TaxID=1276532 RepID=A0A2H1GHL4_ZYMTR|nr:unnamed protein product [Zymoseptoria tritici ST99CH_1E4]